MGSPNDAPVMQGAVDVLKELGISVEMTVASAHRSPERVMRVLADANTRGVSVLLGSFASVRARFVHSPSTRPRSSAASTAGDAACPDAPTRSSTAVSHTRLVSLV